jgi:two-component system response regulator HydG
MGEPATILVIDDQESARRFLGRYLEDFGYRVRLADSVATALDQLREAPVDVVITDLRMPGIDGIQGLRQIKALEPQLPVILLTAYATVETAVRAMQLGAFDYLRKPFEAEEMQIVVARALAHQRLVEENRKLRAEIEARYSLENMVGKSLAMEKVFELIRKVAVVDLPVLITGESGTGKDLVARAIHGLSQRSQQTFLSVNCAAVPESLLESELFGHEKGAFSGALRARQGYFREADGGTLFLDEIGDMSAGQQAKLLHVLESGELIPVGADQPVLVNVRVLAASNQDLEQLAEAKRFRSDLLFRIDTVRVQLPPLRERREDIPLLVAHFLERARLRQAAVPPRMGTAAMRQLLDYDWPGNVRELEHAIDHAVVVAEGGEICAEDLPERSRASGTAARPRRASSWSAGTYRNALRAFEKDYFSAILKRAAGNVSEAAALAGVHRATFYEKLKRLGLVPGEQKGEDGETS